MKKLLSFILLVLVSTAVATAKDIKTIVFTTNPQMHCSNCETKIKKGLRYEKGVKDIVTNVEAQTVTIKYDADKITPEALVKAFEKIGYTATQVKKDEAKGGACCKKQEGCCKKQEKSCCK